jgi:hypothetical protein
MIDSSSQSLNSAMNQMITNRNLRRYVSRNRLSNLGWQIATAWVTSVVDYVSIWYCLLNRLSMVGWDSNVGRCLRYANVYYRNSFICAIYLMWFMCVYQLWYDGVYCGGVYVGAKGRCGTICRIIYRIINSGQLGSYNLIGDHVAT